MKEQGEKIVTTTAFDFNIACIAEEVGTEIVVSGAAMMVMEGKSNMLSTSMPDMFFHLNLI